MVPLIRHSATICLGSWRVSTCREGGRYRGVYDERHTAGGLYKFDTTFVGE